MKERLTPQFKKDVPQQDFIMINEQQQPHNVGAEKSVLGSILIDPSAFNAVSPLLKPQSFYSGTHSDIYAAMSALNEKGVEIDLVTLMDEMGDDCNPVYMSDLVSYTPTSIHAEHYAGIVAGHATRRQIIFAASQIVQAAYDEETSAEDAITAAYGALDEVTAPKAESMLHVSSGLQELVSNILDPNVTDAVVGLGLDELTELLNGGLRPTDLLVIAGRPGMGKSAFALMVAQAAAIAGKSCAIFSMEMGLDQLQIRMLSSIGYVDSAKIRNNSLNNDEAKAIVDAANVLNEMDIFIDASGGIDTSILRAKIARMRVKPDFIVIDHIGLMNAVGPYQNDTAKITQITGALKQIAMHFKIPVIALSQLNREVEKRDDKRPKLSDLRSSGSIEQDADIVMFVYREDYYDENSERPNVAEIITAKNRHGENSTVEAIWAPHYTTFFPPVEREEIDLNDLTSAPIRDAQGREIKV